MQTKKLIQWIIKIVVLLIFIGFLIAFMVKDYSMGYNGLAKSPVTVQVVAGLGIFLVTSTFILEALDFVVETRFLLFTKIWTVIGVASSIVATICYIVASEIIAMIVTILWLVPCGYAVYLMFQEPKIVSLADQRDQHSSILSEEMPQLRKSIDKPVYDLGSHAGRCKCCTLWSYFVLLGIAILAIAVNSALEAYNIRNYGVVGALISVPVYPISQPDGPQINLRIKCTGDTSGKAIFVFEHGGGANGFAFEEIQELLSKANRRSCTYDRPGYGRSQSGANDATPQQDAMRTYRLLEKTGQTGPYIFVGWSAGVQIIQIFNYYHSANVSGLAYIDGYPDYRVLQAIDKNLTEDYVTSARNSLITILAIIKNLEPFGAGAIVGSVPTFHPEEMRDTYEAYYRNYYFWYSQYQQMKNPNDLTKFLTDLGDKQNPNNRPYPNATVSLNWPNITVPLLIMPANSTTSTNNIYGTQIQKYLAKSTSGVIQVLPGEHSIVYEDPSIVAQYLLSHFPS